MAKIKGQFTAPIPLPQLFIPDLAVSAATLSAYATQRGAFRLLDNDNFGTDVNTDDNVTYKTSELGGRIYPITLGALPPSEGEDQINTYTDAQGNQGAYHTIDLECAIVEAVDFSSNVVVTKIQGLAGTVKEFISGGDYDITITGIYNSTQGLAPVDFIANLKDVFNAPVPIPVTNYYLNLLGIYYVVIMPGTTMGQTRGGYSTQYFTIRAISDVPMTEMLP